MARHTIMTRELDDVPTTELGVLNRYSDQDDLFKGKMRSRE